MLSSMVRKFIMTSFHKTVEPNMCKLKKSVDLKIEPVTLPLHTLWWQSVEMIF